MKTLGKAIRRFWANEEGLETVEYAVIAGLLVLAVVGTILGVSAALNSKFTAIEQAINDAQ